MEAKCRTAAEPTSDFAVPSHKRSMRREVFTTATFRVARPSVNARGVMKPRTHLVPLLAATLVVASVQTDASAKAPKIKLSVLDSVTTEPVGEGAAEIVAHDPATQRIFVVNAAAARVDVISIANPANLKKVGEIDFSNFGAFANSVAVKNGIVAVAIEDAVKQNPGKAVFYDANLNFLSAVTVGALPDMITFSPDGRYVVVANEGEPNSTYTVDPEGEVSVIDLSRGAAALTNADVRSANFRHLQKGDLDPKIRISGPNATVAQDMEPEFITVSQDSQTAYVTCQENNAIAVVNLANAKVTKVLPLGYKDYSAAAATTSIYEFDPALMPSIGTTIGGQQLNLGGFSGLHFEGINPVTGKYKFVTHTDRGPNGEPIDGKRPFLLPAFTPEIVRFELDGETGKLNLTQRIKLKSSSNQFLTGLPNLALPASANAPYNDEIPVDLVGRTLNLDAFGGDLEGVVVDPKDGSFWMVDEYRPAIYRFDAGGVLQQRLVPIGTAAAAGQAPGAFGTEVLPSVLGQRRQNRGFEAIAMDNGKIYAFVQSPVRNPVSLSNTALGAMKNVRVVEFDPATNGVRQFIYIMDNADLGLGTNTRADKIGDAVSLGNGEFLVVERDDDKIGSDAANLIEKKIYRCNLVGATDVNGKDGLIGTTGKTIDQLTLDELIANKINPMGKVLHVDLNKAGYNTVEKVEGITVIDPYTLAVINDNDFGVGQITINADGTFTRNYVPESEQLGIISLPPTAIDASDRDSKINITHWPVKGVFMADGIASYRVRSKTYLVTANEGDAREYIPGFVDISRVATLDLDPVKFPFTTWLKNNANLGRLNVINTLGKNPTTGKYEELFSYGARSFSIWTDSGELVWDSGDDLERLTASVYPKNFNASNSSNDFDNRSDDKGPEPEGVAIAKMFGRTYAFVGLERIGGIAIYDISEPKAPEFVQYINNREVPLGQSAPVGDLGPEGLIVIDEDSSPTGKPLLVVANEVSGSTTVYEISPTK
jgi:hypothetical protein